MIQDLNRASDQLRIALDQYLSFCTFICDSSLGGTFLVNDSPFYDVIESESNNFLVHRTKLEQAQVAINSIRNTRSATKINSFPPELLAQVFSLVVDSQHCLIRDEYHYVRVEEESHVLYPDTLSQVCSFWRRTAIALPHIWSHIDIVLNHPRNPALLMRAKKFAVRASPIPLRVHVCDPGFRQVNTSERLLVSRSGAQPSKSSTKAERDPNTMHDFAFLPSSPARIESLDISLGPEGRLRQCHFAALEYLFVNCTPGVLSRYSMRLLINTYRQEYFIEPADSPETHDSKIIAVARRHLENLWLQITTLRLNGPCPPWNSKAYHGLVELRLGEKIPGIDESTLVNMLRSSPELRVFHLRTCVDNMTPLDHLVVPVRLEDLEEVDIKEEYDEMEYGLFLRWIAPGTKPLQLNFYGFPDVGPTSFCTRSNITRFFGEDFLGESLVNMIRRSPWLEVLALNPNGCEGIDLYSILCSVSEDCLDGLVPKTQVDTLYLLNFNQVPFEDIRSAVEMYSVKRLILRCTSITYKTREGRKGTNDSREIRAKLATLNHLSTVEYLNNRCSLDLEHWWY